MATPPDRNFPEPQPRPPIMNRLARLFACCVGLLAATAEHATGAEPADGARSAGSANLVEADLVRLRELHRLRKWRELVDEFGPRDFEASTAAPAQASEASYLRGQARFFLQDGARADADLRRAATLAPTDAAVHLALAENCAMLLGDEARALEAYRQVVQLTGRNAGWMPLTATMRSAQLLIDQVRPDEALAELRTYGDLKTLPDSWRMRLLRTYGHAYAAAGREAESLASFRAALELEETARKGAQP